LLSAFEKSIVNIYYGKDSKVWRMAKLPQQKDFYLCKKISAMQEPFDIEIGPINYSVFPEGNDSYTIFKEGKEYIQIQKDTSSIWLKMDYKTELPIFEEDEEVNAIGQAIENYIPEPEDEEEDGL